MAGEAYAIIGGGGSFGIHAAMYLPDHAEPETLTGIGRNPRRPEPFFLGIERRDGDAYFARHVTHELELLLEPLDREKPQVIVNSARSRTPSCCRPEQDRRRSSCAGFWEPLLGRWNVGA